jgi:hypothetical protein
MIISYMLLAMVAAAARQPAAVGSGSSISPNT